MKVDFQTQDKDKIIADIQNAMGDRALSKMVKFEMGGDELVVVISKMGTSKLVFSEACHDGGIVYTLTKEKIAFAHKAFKDDVTSKIVSVITKAGGKVTT